MATRKGTSFEILTQGFSSLDPKGVSTQGFIEPILGNIIISGAAIVVFSTGTYASVGSIALSGAAQVSRTFTVDSIGNLVTSGAANVNTTRKYIASGGMIIGGSATVSATVKPTVGGQVVISGAGIVTRTAKVIGSGGVTISGAAQTSMSHNVVASGGLVIDGAANVNVTFDYNSTGSITLSGEATVSSNAQAGAPIFGRGAPGRGTRPSLSWDPAKRNADDMFTPMDYLKRMQKAIDKAEQIKGDRFAYLGTGSLKVSGRAQIITVIRDMPDAEIFIGNNPPAVPIVLDLPSVFANGQTAIEIAELEDHLFLNDIMGLGDYVIKTGVKSRFVHTGKKGVSGAAEVKFVSAASKTEHFDMAEHIRRQEDEEFILGIVTDSSKDQEEEELRILGLID